MVNGFGNAAIQSVLCSQQAYSKFLSANDTGATGGHQSGILVSKAAKRMLFDQSLENETIFKKTVKIKWQNDFITESTFTYYKSKNEFRITRFGRGFPFLVPEQTGSLFVLTKQSEEDYSGFFLETEEDIDEFLGAFNMGATETNKLINTSTVPKKAEEEAIIREFIDNLQVDFPSSNEMSLAAQRIQNFVYNHKEYIITDPDRKLIEWTNMEYTLFRAIEHARYRERLACGFTTVDEFVTLANMVLNRRKSRAGKSLEHHLGALFDGNGITYDSQAVTEGKKKPDFLFPSKEAYHNLEFPTKKLVSLAAKTTCKDRWRQILNEADRLRDKPKYLCTLQQGISPMQMDEMQDENVILVVPKPYIAAYPLDRRDRIWTIAKFIEYIKDIEA